MNICVIGTGYVGLVTGCVFADLGNEVVCVDNNPAKVAMLERGEMPIYEPGLEEMVKRNVDDKRLFFTGDLADGVERSDVVFICVGTPPMENGDPDMSYVQEAAKGISRSLNRYKVIVNKSTVPVGTGNMVREIIETNRRRNVDFDVVSNPEFLREGSAIKDTLEPDRIVIGAPNQVVAMKILELYSPLERPMIITDVASAEMIKYASNAFLATKISFANSIANICDAVGADVLQVVKGMGMDSRIGSAFLSAGLGYGGSCFEAGETVFVSDGSRVQTMRFDALFARSGASYQDKGVEVAVPNNLRVLAFDLETGCPRIADVEVVTRRPYRGSMVTLKTDMTRTLRVTADHPVILHTPNGFVTVPAIVVKPGDTLMALTELPEMDAPAPLDLIALLRDTALEQDVHVAPTDDSFRTQYAQFARFVPKDILKHPEDIKRFNRMSLRLFNDLTEQGVLNVPHEKLQLYTAKGAGTRINAVIPVDADLLRLCGYYLAEGYISADQGRAEAVRERIGLCFHCEETEYTSDVERILSRWGMKFIERVSTNARTTLVSSRIFAWLLRDVLGCGQRSEDKSLPALAFQVSPELRLELVRGAFSGDGALTPVMQGKNAMLEYATVSKLLADGMALLLQTLSVVPSLKSRWMNKSKQPAYILRVSGYNQITQLQNAFGAKRQEQIQSILAGYQRHIRQRGFTRQPNFATLRVVEATRETVATTVYSMETATSTLIASSGLICHNCFPKDSSALVRTAEKAGVKFKLLQSVIDVNKEQAVRFVDRLRVAVGGSFDGKTIGILGLAFKPNTDDMRDAKSVEIIGSLLAEGASVQAYDPIAIDNTRRIFPQICYANNAYEVAEDADALVIVTEWNEFKLLNMERIKTAMKTPLLFDGRNIYDPLKLRRLGFEYHCIGRTTAVLK